MSTSSSSSLEISEATIKSQCKKHGGYSTPELNEKLYLHFLGCTRILSGHLDNYTGCTVLYLSHNSLTDLSPLSPLVNLHSLYVSNNGLESCESLPVLPALRLLDISNNVLRCVDNLAVAAPDLETLLASRNRLRRLDALTAIGSIASLDVSCNLLEDADAMMTAVVGMPALSTLILSGNACVQKMPQYRKRLIASLPRLKFLDDYPVFPEEREKSEAFVAGGVEKEKAVKTDIALREAAERRMQFQFFADATEEHPGHCGEKGNHHNILCRARR